MRRFAVVENASGQVIGSTRYYDWNPAEKEIAVGYTFLARRFWGGEFNREMKKLVIEHALRQVEVVWFHVAVMNMRSRRAMEKQGAVLSHHGPRPQNGDDGRFLLLPHRSQELEGLSHVDLYGRSDLGAR